MSGINEEKAVPMRRVVISKRKQTAVERRTGRELLREHDLLKMVTVKSSNNPVLSILMLLVESASTVWSMAMQWVVVARRKVVS